MLLKWEQSAVSVRWGQIADSQILMANMTQLTHRSNYENFFPQFSRFQHDLYAMEQQSPYVFKSKLVGMDYFLVYHKMALDSILYLVLDSSCFHLELQIKLILKTVLWRDA